MDEKPKKFPDLELFKKEKIMNENKEMFLVPIDLMQRTLNALQSLSFKESSGIINEFLQLKAVIVQEANNEVKIEEEGKKE